MSYNLNAYPYFSDVFSFYIYCCLRAYADTYRQNFYVQLYTITYITTLRRTSGNTNKHIRRHNQILRFMITGYAPIKLKIRIDVKNSMIHRYFFASERIFILRLLRLHILKQYCSVSHLFQVATLMEAKTFNQNVWSPHKI